MTFDNWNANIEGEDQNENTLCCLMCYSSGFRIFTKLRKCFIKKHCFPQPKKTWIENQSELSFCLSLIHLARHYVIILFAVQVTFLNDERKKCSFKSLSVRWPTTACITTAISSTVVTRAPGQTLHNNITWYRHTKCKTSFSCQRIQTESELSVTFAWRLLVFWTAALGTCFSFLAVRFDKKLWTRHQDGSWQEREGGREEKRERDRALCVPQRSINTLKALNPKSITITPSPG